MRKVYRANKSRLRGKTPARRAGLPKNLKVLVRVRLPILVDTLCGPQVVYADEEKSR